VTKGVVVRQDKLYLWNSRCPQGLIESATDWHGARVAMSYSLLVGICHLPHITITTTSNTTKTTTSMQGFSFFGPQLGSRNKWLHTKPFFGTTSMMLVIMLWFQSSRPTTIKAVPSIPPRTTQPNHRIIRVIATVA
jgi:hypothetical protein